MHTTYLEKLLNQLEENIANCATLNQVISNATIGWHIEHSLLTINGIIEVLKKVEPNNYKWKFNLIRIVILATKKIPRGKAKSPESVVPKGSASRDVLTSNIYATQQKIEELNSLHKNAYFEHPLFGKLNLRHAIKFLEIHTRHHLDIIEEILAA
jgi:hypothetical protein